MEEKKNRPLYFQHDYHARDDDKVLELRATELGIVGYALHFMCLEKMNENEDGYIKKNTLGGLAINFGVNIAQLKLHIGSAIAIDLYQENENGYTTKRVQEFKRNMAVFFDEKSRNGKKGAKKRWGKLVTKNSSAIVQPNPSHSSAIVADSKLNNTKLNETKRNDIDSVIDNNDIEVVKREGKEKKTLSQIPFFRENFTIRITQEQYNKCVTSYGKDAVEKKLIALDHHIVNGKGKNYTDHYRALLNFLSSDVPKLKTPTEQANEILRNR